MNDLYNIVQEEPPLAQNFKELKEEGLNYIQQISGNEWTNLNPSDPGVTILDQVCYALTELGYCNDFSMEDILTGPNEKLKTKNQFYSPENILTTSPITIDDYRKYLIDSIEFIENAIITPIKSGPCVNSNIYKVYLLINKKTSGHRTTNEICKSAFFVLNKRRNLGELFLMPKHLEEMPRLLRGKITIKKEIDLKPIILNIQRAINNYILPDVNQQGYSDLIEEGLETNAIFNGPLLLNGWILDSSLKPKKNDVHIVELNNLISQIEGVESAGITGIENLIGTRVSAPSEENEILTFDVRNSLVKSKINGTKLKIRCKGRDLPDIAPDLLASIERSQFAEINVPSVDTIKMSPKLPKGKYRDIETYYSIQNTFPEVFAVGADAINSNAAQVDIARSRQLKGYLTLFDQVLANQFSQLANIDKLFSFKISNTGTPTDSADFYNLKNEFQKTHLEYPVPYMVFSPTYFYQSLYSIPYVHPLLKGNETFDYSSQPASTRALKQKSWEKYKLDPYNAYIHGLMSIIEDDNENLTRRNDILDHLLARHGESPLIINAIIDGSRYSGQIVMDQVIFKSLLLQNIGWLSYFRAKAYNYVGAYPIHITPDTICCKCGDLDTRDQYPGKKKKAPCTCKEDKTKEGNSNTLSWICSSCYDESTVKFVFDFNGNICCVPYDDQRQDFIFDANRVDRIEKLKKQDFNNYAAFELKLNLLFGLKTIYTSFLNLRSSLKDHQLMKQAIWLIQERKGFISIESDRILMASSYEVVIRRNGKNGRQYWTINKPLQYENILAIDSWFQNTSSEELTTFLGEPTVSMGKNIFPLWTLSVCDWYDDWFKEDSNSTDTIAHPEYSLAIAPKWAKKKLSSSKDPIVSNTINIFFPNYIPDIRDTTFNNRVELFLENNLPAHVKPNCKYLKMSDLSDLIEIFIDWHNALIYRDVESKKPGFLSLRNERIAQKATQLAEQIIKINAK